MIFLGRISAICRSPGIGSPGDELLLSNGLRFPGAAEEQADLIAKLVDVGASGIAIGEKK